MERLCVRLLGMIASLGNTQARQLTELYRAMRLYVNCFQPSMKLLSKQREGKKVRYVYDPAKTPLQRLLLSGALPTKKQQELTQVAQVLDPIRLFQHVEGLHKAVFRCAASCSPCVSHPPSAPVRVFSVERCTTGNIPTESSVPSPAAGFHTLYREQERRKRILGWRRTQKDPFEGEWEQIISWLVAKPERSSGDIFRDRHAPLPRTVSTLANPHLTTRDAEDPNSPASETFEEQWQEEVIHGRLPVPVSQVDAAIGDS